MKNQLNRTVIKIYTYSKPQESQNNRSNMNNTAHIIKNCSNMNNKNQNRTNQVSPSKEKMESHLEKKWKKWKTSHCRRHKGNKLQKHSFIAHTNSNKGRKKNFAKILLTIIPYNRFSIQFSWNTVYYKV